MDEKEKSATPVAPLKTDVSIGSANIDNFSDSAKEYGKNICVTKPTAVTAEKLEEIHNMVGDLVGDVDTPADSVQWPVTIEGITWEPAPVTLGRMANKPLPAALYGDYWHEGEVACLYADTNVGKSIFAVQIANEIATKERVLYLDIELSDEQFNARYRDDYGNIAPLSPNVVRGRLNYAEGDGDSCLDPLPKLEHAALQLGCRIIIIDNLTYLTEDSIDGKEAVRLVGRLRRLRDKYGWSILLLAHTPKRDNTRPITLADLYGSSRFAGGFDCVIGLNRTTTGQRYVKLVKTRIAPEKTTVKCLSIVKEHGFLRFMEGDDVDEQDLLRPRQSGTVSSSRQENDLQLLYEDLRLILGDGGLSFNKLIARYLILIQQGKTHLTWGRTKLKELITAAKNKGFLTVKNETYLINTRY